MDTVGGGTTLTPFFGHERCAVCEGASTWGKINRGGGIRDLPHMIFIRSITSRKQVPETRWISLGKIWLRINATFTSTLDGAQAEVLYITRTFSNWEACKVSKAPPL